ncbi:Mrr restriction endonuclease-like protein [Nitrosomonas ureae]|uniref:Mrr restriction endonuclease-like protein n=1 Tax=Nitrosomonas ureae TaxID=44577 RepID=A0A2T5IRQ4_9PROT|nr:Mrr restriction endonuclease-like protein [Nitrosomonas ureae]
MSALRELLASYRSASRTEREKGTYFELLIRDFLKNDLTYTPQFSEVWTYKDWAESQGIDSRDIGIDLVAGLNEQEGFCAIQCKFYAENYRIQKSDLDSFFTASGNIGVYMHPARLNCDVSCLDFLADVIRLQKTSFLSQYFFRVR